MGHNRKHFVAVPLDGPFRVKDMAPSIQALKKAAAGSNGAVGVGLLSMMGFEHTRNELSVRQLLCMSPDHGAVILHKQSLLGSLLQCRPLEVREQFSERR